MDTYLELSRAERRLLCESAQVALGLPAASIEKDFWVCWTLRELFALPEWGAHLTFKGGTSLSKCWQLIERFSEDIDVVIDRAFLGFPDDAFSNKRLLKLKEACGARIAGDLLPRLAERLGTRLPADGSWRIEAAGPDEDPDLQTLVFHYPTELAGQRDYVAPVVRIELGARSDTEPAERPSMRPLLADASDGLDVEPFPVRAVAPRRTFWEKAMLLHEETWRPAEKARKARLSRHYYDLWCLITRGVAAEAVRDTGLFDRVARHRRQFFRYSWLDYDTLAPGRLRLCPLAEQEGRWRQDYDAMRGAMFFNEPPPFDEILRVVGDFERAFNAA